MSDKETVFSFRLPEDMYAKLRILAKMEERSINAEILIAVRALIADYERRHGVIKPDDD